MDKIPDDILATATALTKGGPRYQMPMAEAIYAERKRWQREVSDKLYMLQAYREMLGPIGLQVADLWRTNGVQRVHHDWGPDAAAMTGEERAKVLLELDAATRGE